VSKKKYKKGVESIKEQIDIHRSVKFAKAEEEGNIELAGYYEKEIKRLEEQLLEKQERLLARGTRIKLKKKKRKYI
jgi:hypothetical protein